MSVSKYSDTCVILEFEQFHLLMHLIKALSAPMGQMSLSVGWENGPVNFNGDFILFHLTLNFL